MGSINFSSGVYSIVSKEKIRRDIINSTESDPALRREIARIFQKANRRIQNIEEANLFSPAVQALGDRGSKYTKFGMGFGWSDLKREYGKAVAFLREPTSTATGARQYNEHIRQAYGLTNDEYKLMMDKFRGKILSLRDSNFVEKYLMRYKDFTGELEAEAADVSVQIESDAVSLADALQADIRSTTDELLDAGGFDELMREIARLGGNK